MRTHMVTDSVAQIVTLPEGVLVTTRAALNMNARTIPVTGGCAPPGIPISNIVSRRTPEKMVRVDAAKAVTRVP